MISAHTKAILEGNPIYLTGAVTKIPVKGKRSYSTRVKVHKRRSIKPALVKDELKFSSHRLAAAQSRLAELMRPKPGIVERLLKKVIRRK